MPFYQPKFERPKGIPPRMPYRSQSGGPPTGGAKKIPSWRSHKGPFSSGGFLKSPPQEAPWRISPLGIFKSIFGTTKKAPSPPVPTSLFKGEKYRTFKELRQFARKAPYKSIPKYAKKLGKTERVKFIENLKKLTGKSYGMGERDFSRSIKKLKKMKELERSRHDFAKQKELDQKIKQYEAWHKGI